MHKLGPLALRPITQRADSRLWNEYIARYNVWAGGPRLVALLSFGASAWKLRGRDQFIDRQLPHDWPQPYGFRPVLLKTLVESGRHRGPCYKAANWIHVGQTIGRGKKCPVHKPIVPIKDIWLYPLRRDFAAVLGRKMGMG